MSSVQPGDHPLIDLLIYGRHPFPADVEELLLRLYRMNPAKVGEDRIPSADYVDWQAGVNLDAGREKLKGMLANHGGEVDRIMEEGYEKLRGILAHIDLTPEEKQFVDRAARALYEQTFDLVANYPEKNLRPVVITVAMAFWLGPSSVWEREIEQL